MLFVLDTNQFVFSLGVHRKASCATLLDRIAVRWPRYRIVIPRLIVEETRRNLSPAAFREFLELTGKFISVEDDSVVPFDLGSKYEAFGLKPADALVGAFTEWVGAAALVSENRHFLANQSTLPFRILSAEKAPKVFIK